MTQPQNAVAALKRELGFRDLTLFYIASGLSIRWIATAAAAGPSTLVVWLLACVGFFLPLAASVLELSSRYPEEGGLYIWTQRAFGDFSGFIAAWSYWMSNLPYFPAILYFGAGSALFAFGARAQRLAESPVYYVLFAATLLTIITLCNMAGLGVAKWLNNAGALGSWIPVMVLIALALVVAARFGSATAFTRASLTPHLDLRNAVFWSTIFFAFGGCEAGSFMGAEIKNARRVIPRALIFSGALLVLSYLAGTTAMLVALPSASISGLGGFVTVIASLCSRLHVAWLGAAVALLVALSAIGGAAAYLASTSRLPFVAGLDSYLPPVFGRVSRRTGTPFVAIGLYGLAGILFALLSQAGSSVRGAYDLLVSMAIITYFIPYMFLFASMIRLQRDPPTTNAIRLPGGRPVAVLLASIGLVSTALTIVLSVIPSADEGNKTLAVVKVIGSTAVMLGVGTLVFYSGKRRRVT